MKPLTIEQLAEALNAKASWVYAAHGRGELPVEFYIGPSPRFDLDRVIAALPKTKRSLKIEKVSSLAPRSARKESEELWRSRKRA